MRALRGAMGRLSLHQRSAHSGAGRHLCASSALRRFTLAGGTHGNELAGIYLVKHLEKEPHESRDPALRIQYLVSNPGAVARNLRYIDTDLNRCFTLAGLEEPRERSNLEEARARGELRGDFS